MLANNCHRRSFSFSFRYQIPTNFLFEPTSRYQRSNWNFYSASMMTLFSREIFIIHHSSPSSGYSISILTEEKKRSLKNPTNLH